MSDDIRTSPATNTPLFPDAPGMELSPTARKLVDELMATSRSELSTLIAQADIIGRLDTLGEIRDRGGVEIVLGTLAGKAWPKTRVSKRKSVFKYLIDPVGLDIVQDIATRDEKTIRDFEVFYMAAQLVKQSKGELAPEDALSMMYDLSRDQAKALLDKGKEQGEGETEEEEEDTWGDFTQRMPLTLVGEMSDGLALIMGGTGFTNVQFWERLALLMQELPLDEWRHLLGAAEHGYASFTNILAPNEDGEMTLADGRSADKFSGPLTLPAPEYKPKYDPEPEAELGEDGEQADAEDAGEEDETSNVDGPPEGTPDKSTWPRGLSWDASRQKFMAREPGGKRKLIGRFDTFEAGVEALAGSGATKA